MKELEKENAELKKLLADQMLKSKAHEIALQKKHLFSSRALPWNLAGSKWRHYRYAAGLTSCAILKKH